MTNAADTGDQDLPVGTRVGEYVIEEPIGQGAFGTVYRASHPLIGKMAAVKILGRKYSFDARAASRFISEARAVNQIRHAHIIDIFSFGSLPDGRQYHIMELLEGVTLEQLLAERGRLEITEALSILEPIARALDAAHAKGIAHRDLKPANVFLSKGPEGEWFPKLLDFGIAKLMSDDIPKDHATSTGAALGTPYYMSPEQCRGVGVDHRTDIYSFGVLTYRMLTGRLPFEGATVIDLLFAQLNAAPRPPRELVPELPLRVSAAIVTMLEKDPIRRPETASRAVRALEAAFEEPYDEPPAPSTAPAQVPAPVLLLGTLSGTHGTPDLPPTTQGPGTRRTGMWVGLAVMVGIIAAGGVFASRTDSPSLGRSPAPAPATPMGSEPAPVVEAAAPEEPRTVRVTVRDAPEGTQVRAEDGTVLAVVPGTFEIERSTELRRLELSAPGFKSQIEELRPSQNTIMIVKMQREPPPAKAVKERHQKRPPKKHRGDDLPAFDEDSR